MKFPTEFGIGEVFGDQVIARQCYLTTVIPNKLTCEEQTINQIMEIEPQDMLSPSKINTCSPVGETEEVEVIPGQPGKTTKIGKHLQEPLKQELVGLIREFSDIFAWDPKDMPGIPESIARHSLHVNPKAHPVCQNKRVFSEDKQKAIEEEINRLLEAKFIEPVKFPTWISNVVLVKKSNGKW